MRPDLTRYEAAPDAIETRRFDAIVVGAGASGGLAALLLCEAGLDTLVLDAGWTPSIAQRPFHRASTAVISRLADPRALSFLPSGAVWRGRQALKRIGAARQPVQSLCYAWERDPGAFVDDRDCPYATEDGQPFTWLRARQIGGRVAVPGHGRQYYRLSASELSPGDGLSPDWPLQPGELDPWYALVERRLGLTGRRDGLASLPDSEIAREISPEPAETDLIARIAARWPDAKPVLGRYAPPLPSIDQAAATGRLTLRRGAVARRIETDNGAARGVLWRDARTGRDHAAKAPITMLAASTLESVRILMLSGERGLGARSGALGTHLMDHVLVRAEGLAGDLPGGPVAMEDGRCVYLPRFDACFASEPGPRGFGVQAYRASGRPGRSYFTAVAFGEMLPRPDNRVTLDTRRKDAFGAPTLRIVCRHAESDLALAALQIRALAELAEVAGARLTSLDERPASPGTAAHECGGARFGDDPAASVLDPFNQCWDARGLYVVDGAAFPSQGAQNPTLAIMALAARACDHALQGLGAASVLHDKAPAT